MLQNIMLAIMTDPLIPKLRKTLPLHQIAPITKERGKSRYSIGMDKGYLSEKSTIPFIKLKGHLQFKLEANLYCFLYLVNSVLEISSIFVTPCLVLNLVDL